MILMLVKAWREWSGRAALEARVAALHERNGRLAEENARLRREEESSAVAIKLLREDLEKARSWEAAGRFATGYFAGMPRRSEGPVTFTDDDRRDLATWAESPAGAKLLQQLANRMDDYEVMAIRMAGPAQAFALCARARGFRDAVAELKAFTAAGPSPANHEAPEFPLPEGLEHLRG